MDVRDRDASLQNQWGRIARLWSSRSQSSYFPPEWILWTKSGSRAKHDQHRGGLRGSLTDSETKVFTTGRSEIKTF